MRAEWAPVGAGASEGGEPGNDSLLPTFTTLPPGGSMSHEFVEEENPGGPVRRDTTRYREPPPTVCSTHSVNRPRIVYCGQIGLQAIFHAMERPAANVFLYNVTPRKQNASCFCRRRRFRYSRSSGDGTMSLRGRGRNILPIADSAAPVGRHDPSAPCPGSLPPRTDPFVVRSSGCAVCRREFSAVEFGGGFAYDGTVFSSDTVQTFVIRS